MTSSACLTGSHIKCKDRACQCICHDPDKKNRKLKIKELRIVFLAPAREWGDPKIDAWLEEQGREIQDKLEAFVAMFTGVDGLEVKVRED